MSNEEIAKDKAEEASNKADTTSGEKDVNVEMETEEKDAAKPEKKSKKLDRLKKELEEAKAKTEEEKDNFLRLFAEFDNYKKRTAKERLDLIKSAGQEVIVELLPVLDDFERALKQFETSKDLESMESGVKLIFNKFKNILEQKGLKPMQAIGEDFNSEFHEAITEIPAPSEDLKNKVVDEVEKGYLLNEKIIRYAKVVVGK